PTQSYRFRVQHDRRPHGDGGRRVLQLLQGSSPALELSARPPEEPGARANGVAAASRRRRWRRRLSVGMTPEPRCRMKPVKAAASLSSSLLLLKGRTNPAALVDQILGEVSAARASGAPVELQRPEAPQLTRTHQRPETNVVMPWRGPVAEPRRPVLENVSRKKLSLRLARVPDLRPKPVGCHPGHNPP